MKSDVIMSQKEVDRIEVMEKLSRKELTHDQASKILGISIRQSKRLKKKYIILGAKGLVHISRGQPSNRKISDSDIEKVIEIIKKDYYDFKPTLAHEKLQERELISFSIERLRRAMIKNKLYKPKRRKNVRIHTTRERRACLGELIQIDGSPHKWFEDRASKCTLIAYIDDATSRVLFAKFVESESTWSYFECTEQYLELYGKPLALYTDKHGVFRINATNNGITMASDSHGYTQFGRALNDLGIECIHANSPQAKGRIERLFGTLQDRLVKELRLNNISSMEEANDFLPEYLEKHNNKFAVIPLEGADLHQPLNSNEKLSEIFTKQSTRTLSKTLTCQYDNKKYQITTDKSAYILRNVKITVKESRDGIIQLSYKGKQLDYSILVTQPKVKDANAKDLTLIVDKAKEKRVPRIPSANHPWRRTNYQTKQKIKERELVCQK